MSHSVIRHLSNQVAVENIIIIIESAELSLVTGREFVFARIFSECSQNELKKYL